MSSLAADTGGYGGNGAARVTIICSVCVDTLIEDGSVQVATPCGHVFHKHCLINWYNNPKRNESQEKYCCPNCGARTESDSDCEFRLFLDTEEDSDLANLQTVTQLGREKDEIIQRLNQDVKALERLSEEQAEAVVHQRLEHTWEVARLRLEHGEQIKRLQLEQVEILGQENAKTKTLERTVQQLREENVQSLERLSLEQVATVDRVRRENSKETERLWQLIKFHKDEIQLLKDEIQCQKDEIQCQKDEIQCQKDEIQWHKDEVQSQKDEIQFLKKPMHLLQKRVKTLATEKLQREMDTLKEKYKRLVEVAGSNSCRAGAKTPGFEDNRVGAEVVTVEGGGVAPVLSLGRATSQMTKVTNTLSKTPGSGNSFNTVTSTTYPPISIDHTLPVPTTPSPQPSSSEKRGVNASEGCQDSGVAAPSKKQKIDDNPKNCGSINPTLQNNELIEDEDEEEVMYQCKRCPGKYFTFEEKGQHSKWHKEQKAFNDTTAREKQEPHSSGVRRGGVNTAKRGGKC